MKIAIYTAVYGEKDILKKPLNHSKAGDVDWYYFSDVKFSGHEMYKNVYCSPVHSDLVKNARKLKIRGFPGDDKYDYVIWHDGNIQLDCSKISSLIEEVGEKSYLFFKHRYRSCPYQESLTCIDQQKDYPIILLWSCMKLFFHGIKANSGLYETGLTVKNMKFRNFDFENQWWKLVEKYSRRDQIMLPLAIKKTAPQFSIINHGIDYKNFYCKINEHIYPHYKDSNFVRKIFDNRLTRSLCYRAIKMLIRLSEMTK